MKCAADILMLMAFATLLSGCSPSAEEQVNKLLVEAQTSVKQLPALDRRVAYAELQTIKSALDRIVTEFPQTDMAVALSSGQSFGPLSIPIVNERLVEMRLEIANVVSRDTGDDNFVSLAGIDGGTIVVGSKLHEGADQEDKAAVNGWVRKVDPNGETMWDVEIDAGQQDGLSSAVVLSDGSLVVGGTSYTGSGVSAAVLYSVDGSGAGYTALIAPDGANIRDLASLVSGGFAAVSTFSSADVKWTALSRYAADYSLVSSDRVPDFVATNMLAADDGTVLLVGNTWNEGWGSAFVSIAADGTTTLVPLEVDSNSNMVVKGLAGAADGGFYVAGQNGPNGPWLAKFTKYNILEWQRSYPIEAGSFTAVSLFSDGDLAVAGSFGSLLKKPSVFVARLSPEGDMMSRGDFDRNDIQRLNDIYVRPDQTMFAAGAVIRSRESSISDMDGWLLIDPPLEKMQ